MDDSSNFLALIFAAYSFNVDKSWIGYKKYF